MVTIKDLLEAGVHFGHQTKRWNPKMKRYIFIERNGVYIIDLQKTLALLEDAVNFVGRLTQQKGTILFIGTKKQAQEVIQSAAEECGMPYIVERWFGGMLTNFTTIARQIRQLKALEKRRQDGSLERMYTKKERLKIERKHDKLQATLGGVKEMATLPDAIFVVDAKKEAIAIQEAHKLGIPSIAILDTNADPDIVDYPIPGNDDAIRSIKTITNQIKEAILTAREGQMISRYKEGSNEEEMELDNSDKYDLEGDEDE